MPTAMPQKTDVYEEIRAERVRQNAIWGGPVHDDEHEENDWAEFIEQRTEVLMESPPPARTRELFIHIGALAVAAIESMDRRRSPFPPPPDLSEQEQFLDWLEDIRR